MVLFFSSPFVTKYVALSRQGEEDVTFYGEEFNAFRYLEATIVQSHIDIV